MRGWRFRGNHISIDIQSLPLRVIHMRVWVGTTRMNQYPLLTSDWINKRTAPSFRGWTFGL